MFDHPAVVGVLIGLPSVILGFLVYRQSKKTDEVAATTGSFGAVFEGFDHVVAALRANNVDLRARAALVDVIEANVRKLLTRIHLLERHIMDNGLTVPENGAAVEG